jgi:hypothetical protein
MVLFLPIFMKLPLIPKENGRCQAAMEPDLESLLPASVQLPKITMNHGAQLESRLSHSV